MSKNDLLKDIEKAIKDIDLEDLLESLGEKISEELSLKDLDRLKEPEGQWIELFPFGLMSGQGVGKPVFIFKDEEETYNLPVRLGNLQASLVALGLGPNIGTTIFGFSKKLFKTLDIEVLQVVFHKVKDSRLMAKVEVKSGDTKKWVQTSAEEVLAFALESKAEFYSTEEVIDTLKSQNLDDDNNPLGATLESAQEGAGQKYMM